MSRRLFILAALLVLNSGGTAMSETAQPLQEKVRAAETAFARTMADRDLEAFGASLAEEAVFFGSTEVHRGKKAITTAWSAYFASERAPFSWHPEIVEVLASGTLALSSGPVFGPDGNQIGTFNSIWRLEADGKWRVVFDKGCPHCP
jgi:ketosteroid isomerase-like protein